MKKGSYWLMLLALIFVVAAGGCGGGGGDSDYSGGGGGGGSDVSGPADVLNGSWSTSNLGLTYFGDSYSGISATLVLTGISNNNTANRTTKHLSLTPYIDGDALDPLVYRNLSFTVSNSSGSVTIVGITGNGGDYIKVSGNSSALDLYITDAEGYASASGRFTRISGYALTEMSNPEPESIDSVNDLVTTLKEKF
jgi:hypothetical protein